VTQQQQGGSGTNVASIPHYVAVDFAHATSIVLYVMCGVMAFAGVVALFGLERGRQEETSFEAGDAPATSGAV
jgi:hypothetical protein